MCVCVQSKTLFGKSAGLHMSLTLNSYTRRLNVFALCSTHTEKLNFSLSLPFRRGRRNKTKFAEAKLGEKAAANDSAHTETADLTRGELGARDVKAEQATHADIHSVADDTSPRAESESSDTEDMSEGGNGAKKKRGRRGKKNKNKHLASSKDAGETKQPPPTQTTGGEAILTNGIADVEKVLQEVVESDIVPVSASAAALSSAAPATPNSGNQNGKLPENEMGLSLEFIDAVIDCASNQEQKEKDSRRDAENSASGDKGGGGSGDGSVFVTDGDSSASVLVRDVAALKSAADPGETESTQSRDSVAEIEAEAEAMALALADVSVSTVSSDSIDSSASTGGGGGAGEGGGGGEGKTTGEEEKPKSTGSQLKKILRRKISHTLFHVDLEQCDPEIAVTLLKIPSMQTFGALKKKLKGSGKDWMQGFLDHEGLEALLDCIDSLGGRRVTQLSDALLLLECVACVKCVMNSKMGLELLVQRPDYVCRLVKGEQISVSFFFSSCCCRCFVWVAVFFCLFIDCCCCYCCCYLGVSMTCLLLWWWWR